MRTDWQSAVLSLPQARLPYLPTSAVATFSTYLELQNASGWGVDHLLRRRLAQLLFLWYNALPQRSSLGDVGSLALGGAIGTVAS
jgi:hypothetical protein